MPYISQSSIQELTDRLDAVAVFSDYVNLEKRGGRLWACCPFHQEKTGSFTVNPDLKTYYCFGCQKGGSAINFVMEMDKLSFPEAIELLAKRFAVELVYEKSGGGDFSAADEAKKKAKDELFELYKRISGTFHHFLLKNREAEEAKMYIISRGFNNEMIEQFRLGYAPADRYWLFKFLTQKGYSRQFLAASGLFSSRQPESSLFHGRLMFPINDRQGRTVAFGGRYLGKTAIQGPQPPKYINSPELGIYKKGETLYAVDLALSEIRKTKIVYIAEGYTDVIALHQAGINNAVAPLGTAFTEDQAKLLRRWAEKIIFFFDSDEAGQTAAVKGIFTCRKNGLTCAIVKSDSENGKGLNDPADILKDQGPEELQKRAKCYINDFSYLLNKAKVIYDAAGPASFIGERKAKALSFLFPYIKLLESEVARDSCIEAAADIFGLPVKAVADDYRRELNAAQKAEHGGELKPSKEEHVPLRMNDELLLLIVVAIDYFSSHGENSSKERLFSKFRSAIEINEISDPNAKEVFITLEECVRYEETNMDDFLARISSPELKKTITERSATGEFSVNPEQLVNDGIKKLKKKKLERLQKEIVVKLRLIKKSFQETDNETGEAEDHGFDVHELLAEKMQIDNELHLLMQGR